MLRKQFSSSDDSSQIFSGEPRWLNDLSNSWDFNSDINYGISEYNNTI